ncbi:MAG TPA: hypothetical protein VJV78_47935 [Polyangiales bacterium]|nr:hypothetical protein [Polyangiales bacterium]
MSDLVLRNDASLADISALAKLRAAESIILTDNAMHPTLHGLEALMEVGAGGVVIRNNAALRQLRALSFLTISAGGMTIRDNPELPQCEIDWLAARLPYGFSMGNNGPPGTCSP